MAGHSLKFDRVAVIYCQFFASVDLPAAEEEQAVANTPPGHIGITRVVNELGAAAPRAAVQKPPAIHLRNVHVLWRLYVPYLLESEVFAGVFDDAVTPRNILKRKYAVPVEGRGSYSKIITCCFRVDLGGLRVPRFHFES